MKTQRLFRTVVAASAVFAFGLSAELLARPVPQSSAAAQAATAASSSTHAAASAAKDAQSLRAGTKISTQLESTLDARTAKPGQQVEARVTKNVKEHGRTVIHKGDMLVGHVTNVKSNASGSAGSQIGVAFNELRSHGATTQLNAVLTSVFSAQGRPGLNPGPMAMPEGAPMPAPAGGGGGLLDGAGGAVGSTAGGAIGGVGRTAGGLGAGVGSAANGTLGAGANGSAGLLAPTPTRLIHLGASGSAESSAGAQSNLSTRHGNLRLDSGTQMQFRVAGQSQAARSPRKR